MTWFTKVSKKYILFVNFPHVAGFIDCLWLQVNYKSDLNWIKGVGWTPPGSLKVEMARRAAELGLAEGVTTDEAIAQYQQFMVRQMYIIISKHLHCS